MTQKKILIVENDGIIASRIEDILVHRGYAAVSVGSGEEAVAAAVEDPPDLALMDVHLSRDMDGVAAAERIRAHQNIPVVFLTAYSDDALLQRAKSAVPYGYLLKPVRDRELLATLEMAFCQHEADHRLHRKLTKTCRKAKQVIRRIRDCWKH